MKQLLRLLSESNLLALLNESIRVLAAKARFRKNKITLPDLEMGLLRCIAKNVKANIILTLAAVKQNGH